MYSKNELIDYFSNHRADLEGHLNVKSQFSGGPSVLIVGGTHGNEPCGVEAIVQWHKLLKQRPELLLSGDVHFLLGNPKAFEKDVRYVDHDLNRSFSRLYSSQQVESRRSQEISSFIKSFREIEAVIDLHSVSKGNSQMLIYSREQKNILPFMVNLTPLNIHLSYMRSHIPGLLIDECQTKAKRSLAIECGNHVDPHASKVASFHIYRLLNVLGMIPAQSDFQSFESFVEQSQKVDLYETMGPIVPEDGFEFTVDHQATMTFLEKGAVFARTLEGEQVAPNDCYLVMPPAKVQKSDIDAGFLCQKHTIKRSDYEL